MAVLGTAPWLHGRPDECLPLTVASFQGYRLKKMRNLQEGLNNCRCRRHTDRREARGLAHCVKEYTLACLNIFTDFLKINVYIDLCIWLCWVFVAAHRISSLPCSLQDLLAAACTLLVATFSIQLLELNPGPLHWEGRLLTTGPPGKSLSASFFQGRS